MPANLRVEQGKKPNQWLLYNEYPNEPKANNKDKLILSRDGLKLNKRAVFSKKNLPDGGLEVSTQHKGKDNNKKALIRHVFVLSNKRFIMRKEVQLEGSIAWVKRNEYSYSR